jgi:hypothetical protein
MCALPTIIKLNLLENKVINFWKYSEGERDDFEFLSFFILYKEILKSKLSKHGMLGLDNYLKYTPNDISHTTHDGIVLDSNLESRYQFYKVHYQDNLKYKELLTLYNDLENSNFAHLNYLMDRCIHAEHNSGTIIRVKELREYYDNIER